MEAIKEGWVEAEVRIVISDVEDAGILKLALEFDVPSRYVPPGRFRTKLESEIEHQIVQILRDRDVELVVLAGVFRVLKMGVLHRFAVLRFKSPPCRLSYFPRALASAPALNPRPTRM